MRLALRGLRNLDNGNEQIRDEAERAALRRQATKVYIQSVVAAVVLTLAAFAIP